MVGFTKTMFIILDLSYFPGLISIIVRKERTL
jgi:hypothetical protein